MSKAAISDFSAKERILVVEVNWLGDVLFSTAAIRAIRKKYPGAYIAALVVPRCKAVLLGNNYIDEVMALDEAGRHKGFMGKLRLIMELKKRRFTIAYFFKASLTRIFCAFLAGIPKRIGFAAKMGGMFLSEKVFLPKEAFHRADTFYYLVTRDRIPESERYYDFFISIEDQRFVDDLFKKHNIREDKDIVVLHVGGNWDLKRWPKESFARLIDVFAERYGAEVVISGSFMDHSLAAQIAGMSSHKPFIACGLTTLKQLGALFRKSSLVVSADSGPLHIALAMEARTIALFGPTATEVTGPLGRGEYSVLRIKDLSCRIPCYNLECKDNICMTAIKIEDVWTEAERLGWLKPLK
ncbi:MAG TPA: lipopolysaccharide heptosyltransferase II [Candidatus Omnitrophica bacterium]|nr:lipopolysaccharide heptosyltransferase II [Candidatus Omnitrophota bacterium]